jgi:hypothetical protein
MAKKAMIELMKMTKKLPGVTKVNFWYTYGFAILLCTSAQNLKCTGQNSNAVHEAERRKRRVGHWQTIVYA